jgi:hypothetical protein
MPNIAAHRVEVNPFPSRSLSPGLRRGPSVALPGGRRGGAVFQSCIEGDHYHCYQTTIDFYPWNARPEDDGPRHCHCECHTLKTKEEIFALTRTKLSVAIS